MGRNKGGGGQTDSCELEIAGTLEVYTREHLDFLTLCSRLGRRLTPELGTCRKLSEVKGQRQASSRCLDQCPYSFSCNFKAKAQGTRAPPGILPTIVPVCLAFGMFQGIRLSLLASAGTHICTDLLVSKTLGQVK